MLADERRNQATWERTAEDLSDDVVAAGRRGVLSIEQAAAGTGLSVFTIDDVLLRRSVAAPGTLRATAARPEFRIGSTPYWSREQFGPWWLPDGDERAAAITPDDWVETGDASSDEPLAVWQRTARNLAACLSAAVELDVRTLVQVADATGLSVGTIEDSLFRHQVRDEANPRAHLCRPAYRVDATPLWSREQVAAALAVVPAARTRTGRGPKLPLVERDSDTVSIREITAAVGRHEQTVRKWLGGSYPTADGTTPPSPTGRRAQPPGRRQGNPETVYDREPVRRFLVEAVNVEAPALESPATVAALREQMTAAAEAVAAG